VRWVGDVTGRFAQRPHYTSDDLETIAADLRAELRTLRPPGERALSVDDLSVLLESRAGDVDLYASDLPAGIDGVTEFIASQRPRVRIAESLSAQRRFAARLRTTLAHELGHIVLHDFLMWLEAPTRMQQCGTRQIAPVNDWMEWQANYLAGALLIPMARVKDELGSPVGEWTRSSRGRALVQETQRAFEVSAPAASVRLLQLGYLSARPKAVARAPVPHW
jgi:hypothetical protein